MIDSYDETRYTNACASCGRVDQFKRERELHEVEQLALSESGVVHVDDSDTHESAEWRYECVQCGASSDDLEDLLVEIEDEDDEEFEDAESETWTW